ncbi:MAG: hypothetical protein AAF478_09445 [Pseudomonadota bacterium]
MADKINPVRETDEEALGLVAKLLGDTRYASLGVSEIGSGIPLVSRVAAAWSVETGIFFCASDLSVHSKCLAKNASCSLMVGEPGKGDGLAYPRVTLIGSAERMENADSSRDQFKEIFLRVHPKANLYVDFLDFGFYPINLERALLNGGFGKAYHLTAADLSRFADNRENNT